MPQSPNILLLEDTRTVQNYIRDVLRSLPDEPNLLLARKVEEAQSLAMSNRVDLFIVDIGLPDGDGIDYLCDMATIHPDARALVITSTPREDYRDRARSLGVLNFLTKPLQRKQLLDAVTRLISSSSAGSETAEEPTGFEVTLGGLSPADIIQLKCLGRATGVVEFSHEDRIGLVWFTGGEITHAECSTNELHQTGPDAFRTIIAWRTGTVRELPEPPPAEQTIRTTWQSLLMDATAFAEERSVAC